MFFQERSYSAALAGVEAVVADNAHWLQLCFQCIPASEDMHVRWTMFVGMNDDIKSMLPSIQERNHVASRIR